ncbi:putative ribonuclease H-like domain-containing protein [Tanacetum coccineum]
MGAIKWNINLSPYRLILSVREVIQNGNGPVSITTDTQGQIKILPPRTAEEILARERERKARTTLLMALPEDHLAKFHKMTDAKEMWEAIRSRFGGNDESKKMQKYILKQQFEGFSVSNSEGLHKGYDRNGLEMAGGHDFNENEKVLQKDRQGILLESAEPREIKIVKERLLETLRNKDGRRSEASDTAHAPEELLFKKIVSTARASGTNNVSTARHNFKSQAVLTNAARKISTVKPFVNRVRPKTVFHKTHSPFRRPFNNTTALRTKFSKQKVNTGEVNAVSAVGGKRETADYTHRTLQNKGIVDSGCSRHITGNKAYLAEYQDFNGGPVAFEGSKCYIIGNGKIKIGKLDFEDVCFVKELQHFNLFYVSQICDKKNKVLFTDSECLVLSPEFKLPDANQVLLRIPRQNNMYSFNLENLVPSGGLACLIAKATIDESNKWHRRLGHVNFKNLNKLVKGNLVRGLPSKIFQNDHTCVACQKGKQHKASCKAKSVSSISQPLQLLHMDLFGPTSVRSLNHKTYCLVITDDFSRFSWVFFLRTKDETSGILKDFIRQIENQLNQKVKTIRCDNGTEFKNRDFIEFCGSKGIKREYSNARTPQQNGVAERKNRTLIEAARTMLADSFLPNTFWAEAVSTACYVLNRVLVTKPQNKTPYELVTGKIPIISYIRPFGCHVTILNTIDHLGKFDGKSDEGFRKGPTWLFDLDYLTDSMIYQPVRSENQANKHAGPQEYNQNAGTAKASSTNIVNTVSTPVSTASTYGGLSFIDLTNTEYDDSEIPALEEIYANPTNGRTAAIQDSESLILVDLPYGKKAIGTKWVYRNKKDERGVVVRNKARLVAQGHRQEEGIDYDEVFALWPVCACSRFQVNPKTSHLSAVKRIFRRDLFLGNAKKQTIVAYFTTEQNMLLLQLAVAKFYGFKIKC